MVVPKHLECTYDLEYVAAVHLQNEVLISFDAPFDIPHESIDSTYNIDLGENLTVYVNSTEATNYKAGLYAPKQPGRLFILLQDFRRGDNIQVQIETDGVLYCSPAEMVIDYIDPYVKPIVEIENVCKLSNADCQNSMEPFCSSTCSCLYWTIPCP